MADTKTTDETTRSPLDGTELVRLATSGANWKTTVAALRNFGLTGGNFVLYDNAGAIGEASLFTIQAGQPEVSAGGVYSYDGVPGLFGVNVNASASWFIGGAGNLTETGTFNQGMGPSALASLTTGTSNVAVGKSALTHNTTGHDNTAIGSDALRASINCTYSVAIGGNALLSSVSDFANVAIGRDAGILSNGGQENTFIGYACAQVPTTAYQCIVIGSQCDVPSAVNPGQLSIGNFIYGTGLTGQGSTISTGRIGIGVKSPAAILDIDGRTQTSSVPALNITQTWNNAGVQFIGQQMTITPTAYSKVFGAGASMTFQYQMTGHVGIAHGDYSNQSTLWLTALGASPAAANYAITGFTANGTNNNSDYVVINAPKTTGIVSFFAGDNIELGGLHTESSIPGMAVPSSGFFGFSSGTSIFDTTSDVKLFRDAAGTLALRNSTNPQTFRVYNTYTSGANYERAIFDWNNTLNVLTIGTEKAAPGAGRNMQFIVDGLVKLDFGVTTVNWWSSTANFKFAADLSVSQGTMYVNSGTFNVMLWSGANFGFSADNPAVGTSVVDAGWFRDAANIIAQRNSTNPQTYRVYNTWSAAGVNYERGVFDWSTTGNVLTIGTQKGGTGTTRNFQFVAGGTSVGDYGITNAPFSIGMWTISGGLVSSDVAGGVINADVTAIAGNPVFIGARDDSANALAAFVAYGANAISPTMQFYKTRSTTDTSANNAVNNGDGVGAIEGYGADGNLYKLCGRLQMAIDGATISSTSMPGRFEFYTTPSGTVTPVERVRIDNTGSVVVGGTSAKTAFAGIVPTLQVVGTSFNTASIGLFEYSTNNTAYNVMEFSKSRNATVGSHTIVQTGDFLGEIDFNGSDGNAAFRNAASITAEVDTGTPSTTSMPGRLVLWTTPDASTTASRRMTITASGLVGIASTAPTSNLHVGGSYATSTPVTTTSTAYTVTSTDVSVVYNTTATATTTLPTASSFSGRWLHVKVVTNQAVVSASSNVIPLASTVVGTTILSSTAGKWASLHSDGSNWIVMAGN